MTGKQIAKNLQGSKRKWGKNSFYDKHKETFCVLGTKLVEAGVSKEGLQFVDAPYFGDYARLGDLVHLNDKSKSKHELIESLESAKYATINFPVERFIRDFKKAIKKENE